MNMVQTSGGALILLPLHSANKWGGVFRCELFKNTSKSCGDYDAMYQSIRNNPLPTIGVVKSDSANILLMAEPLPTLIVDNGPDHLYISQVDTSEEGWSESELRASDFESTISWQYDANFIFDGGAFIIFDSSADRKRIGNAFLSGSLSQGAYLCSSALQKWEGKASLIFIRLIKYVPTL